jgi:hypothetical protein
MARISFASYCTNTGVTTVCPSVRENTNGYPFITVLRGNVAENIYFGIDASSEVSLGQDTKSIAKNLFVVDTINAGGESRTKLSFKNADNAYYDINDLF